jgi:V/A-type H+-transporting ATPase subunit I
MVYHKEYQEFLTKIRELGAVHIIEKEGSLEENPELDQLLSLHKKYTTAIKQLSRQKNEEKPASSEDGLTLLNRYEEKSAAVEKAAAMMLQNEKELAQFEPWGNFSWNSIQKLNDAGFHIRFFSCPTRKLQKEWEEEYNVFYINEISSVEYFITVTKDSEFYIDADEIRLPKRSAKEIAEAQKKLESEIARYKDEIQEIAETAIPVLQQARDQVQEEIDFSKVVLNTSPEAENKVMVLEAWVSEEKTADLNAFLDTTEAYYDFRNPEDSDKVPIKLKNNRFARLYEMIGELYSLPNYNEIDLTPFFAPFYMLFFGFCLGDAGYGLLFILAALFARSKVKPEMKPLLGLITWLGVATVIMGAIGGTVFGMNLIEADVSWLEDYKKYMLNPDKLFNLALIVGAVQIIFGMFIKVANITKRKSFRHAFGTIGWIILILGGGAVYLLNSQEILTGTAYKVALYSVLGVFGLLALVLNDPNRNIFMNIGSGLWDSYNMVTGLLGDVLSYIRLFALGISSAVMGFVFNDLAISLSGNTPVVSQLVMVIILLIGHGMNIFMSGLGSMVHPMRLTFVEFYKNAGFEGGGKKYSPFSKIVK